MLFKAFAPEVSNIGTFKVKTAAEMDTLLSDKAFQTATYPQVSNLAHSSFNLNMPELTWLP